MRSILLATVLLHLSPALSAQQQPAADRFTHQVMTVKGDLNKDGLEDMATVWQDTTNEKGPYRLQVFFAHPGGAPKLVISTEKAIEPEFPDGSGGYRTGTSFDKITISNGVLGINVQLLRGHYEHRFRYQNGNFELIGFSMVSSDGIGTMTTTGFNLTTGWREEKQERYDTDKVLSNTKKKVWIRPLPKLQDFRPLESEVY